MSCTSDALVVFGMTGDLAYKQIFPALQAMIQRGHLDVPIIGVARSGNLDQLRARARDSLDKHGGVDEKVFAKLFANLKYVAGDYEDPAIFESLRKALGDAARPLHYLAVPPPLFAVVAKRLSESGCAKDARVVCEKPFGHDLAGRERFYEETGAIRDVVQNHLLQVTAILASDPPAGNNPEASRDEKTRIFQAMRTLAPSDVVRGQFAGYRKEHGVAADSSVETFAAVRLAIDTWRWRVFHSFYGRASACR